MTRRFFILTRKKRARVSPKCKLSDQVCFHNYSYVHVLVFRTNCFKSYRIRTYSYLRAVNIFRRRRTRTGNHPKNRSRFIRRYLLSEKTRTPHRNGNVCRTRSTSITVRSKRRSVQTDQNTSLRTRTGGWSCRTAGRVHSREPRRSRRFRYATINRIVCSV